MYVLYVSKLVCMLDIAEKIKNYLEKYMAAIKKFVKTSSEWLRT